MPLQAFCPKPPSQLAHAMSVSAETLLADIAAVHELVSASLVLGGPSVSNMVEMQVKALEAKVLRCCPNTVQATQIIQLISAGPWPGCAKASLCSLIHQQLGQTVKAEMAVGTSCKNQSLLHIQNYLSATSWATLTAADVPQASKLQVLATCVASLGCKSPSEKSVQAMVGFALVTAMGLQDAQKLSPAAKLCVVHDFKRLLKRSASERAMPNPMLAEYPETPKELMKTRPDIYKLAFGAEEPQLCQIHAYDLMEAISIYKGGEGTYTGLVVVECLVLLEDVAWGLCMCCAHVCVLLAIRVALAR